MQQVPPYSQPFANQFPAQIPNQPQLQGPDETSMMPTQRSVQYNGEMPPDSQTQRLPPPHDQTPVQATSLPFESDEQVSGSGSGHLANGFNMFGTELRQVVQTATERALEMQIRNEQLREQLKAMTREAEKLAVENAKQKASLEDSNERLNKSNRLAASLREKIATLNVEVQELQKEKVMIEINADKALKEIESELDAMLLDSLSQLKK